MSSTTFSLTMQDIKSEEGGTTGHDSWQGYRVPLPAPQRVSNSYDPAAPLSAPLVLLYNGNGNPPKSYYQPMHITTDPLRLPRAREDRRTMAHKPALTSHRSYPTLKRPYESFEELSYNDGAPELHDSLHDVENSAKPTIQSDHRLLSFGPLPQRHTVLDEYGGHAKLEVAAQIHGMFFLSEMASHTPEGVIMQPELTCYRRNLFQISGSVICPPGNLQLLTDRGETIPIVSQELVVSAMESVDGHVIRLIVIPWKTPPQGAPEPPPNTEQEPSSIPINLADGEIEEKSNGMLVQQISWRRLQFRVATANNGRRKELQQHFVLRLKLIATLGDGAKLCIHESTTAPIVVRGRSPRNFQARKEIPLVGSSASPRGPSSQISPVQKKVMSAQDRLRSVKPEALDIPKRPYQYDTSSFSPSPLMIRNGSNYVQSQWNPSQHHSEHSTASTTPTYPQVSLPPYLSNIPQPTDAPNPSSAVSSQPQSSTSEPGSRSHFYQTNSAASFSPQPPQYVEGNPRPTKSPRHTMAPDLSAAPIYSTYDERVPQNYPHGMPMSNRVYYSTAPAGSETWTTSEQPSAIYATTMQPPPHPIQPSQNYSFPSETYVREEPQQIQYSWSAA